MTADPEPATTAAPTSALLDSGWLEACRRMVAAQRELFEAEAGIAARTVYAGRGEGGDRSLVIDRRAEDIVFAELEALAADGHSFCAVSEERGEIAFGAADAPARVVIDPIDGSLNARRTIPAHALSLAVASGASMADVELAYVYDFGAAEEFWARRGEGAKLDGEPIRAEGPGYGLEVVGIEASKPERLLPLLEGLSGSAFRIRSIGSIALSLCYVASGRFDGMLTARGARSVDAAAAQLVVREAGGLVELPPYALDGASLDLSARYHVTAALDPEGMSTLREVQARAQAPTSRE